MEQQNHSSCGSPKYKITNIEEINESDKYIPIIRKVGKSQLKLSLVSYRKSFHFGDSSQMSQYELRVICCTLLIIIVISAVKILNHAVSEVCDDDKHNITDNYNEPIEDIDKIPPG